MTNDTKCTQEIKSRIFMATAPFNRKKALFTTKLDLNFRQKVVNCCIWSTDLYGAETGTLRKVDQKYLKIFKIWCWRRMDKITLTDDVRSEEVSRRVKKERNILQTIERRKAN